MKFLSYFKRSPVRTPQWWWISLIAVMLLGVMLRPIGYAQFPIAGETKDEVAWTMLGASLLQTGTPQSWSFFSAYTNVREVELAGSTYRLVTPTVDHPPLFGLIPGLVSTLQGKSWDELPSVVAIRAPLVLLSIFNLAVFALVARRWLGTDVGSLVATALFAVVPSWVFLQRLVVSENLVLTWILLILLTLTYSTSRWARWTSAVALAALPLTKISGLAVVAGTLAGQWQSSWKGMWRWLVGGAAAGVGLLIAYAAWVDLGLFWQVQTQQAARDTGLLTLYSSQIWAPTLVRDVFAEPWMLLGMIATLGVLAASAKALQLKVTEQTWNTFRTMFVAQFAFVLLSVGEHTVHGWYRIVWLPFFALALGIVAQWMWQKRSLWSLAVAWLVLGIVARQGLWYWFGPDLYQWQSNLNTLWLVGAGGIVASELWLSPLQKDKAFRALAITLAAVILLSSTVTILSITDTHYWQDREYLETGLRS